MIDSSQKLTRIELVYTVILYMIKELSEIPALKLPKSLSVYLKKGHKNTTIYKIKPTEESSRSKIRTGSHREFFNY